MVSALGLKAASECISCDSGYYCVDGRGSGNADYAADQCAAGYYCKSGATTPTPQFCPPTATCSSIPDYTDPEEAYYCPPGHYCGPKTTQPSQCEPGKFRLDPGAMTSKECTLCLPGTYCIKGSTTPFTCPRGGYCPLGSSYYKECPMGTYNPTTGAKYEHDCMLCPPGRYCSDFGIGDITIYPCPPSSYCLEGTIDPILCLAGLYILGSGDSEDDCKPCTEHFYCPSGTVKEEYCPNGHECPELSPAPSACEAGYCCYW
jgi:hypothetical protein